MNQLSAAFTQHFGDCQNAFTVIAPGRVNLIGEHVDYNDGLVLPMAISLQTTLLVRPRNDRQVDLIALNLENRAQFSLDELTKRDEWMDYVQGVAQQLENAGFDLRGFEGVVQSSVPTASGLSSSAALEVGAAHAFLHVIGKEMAPLDLAQLCQRAENQFVGVNCGIMDQAAVATCQAHHALLLDCRSLQTQQVPLNLGEHCVVVIDSGAPRELASSAYNQRRSECEAGLQVLAEHIEGVHSLRDVTPAQLEQFADKLDATVLQRVRHVVSEIARTQEAAQVLADNDLTRFGQLMNQSHDSLRDDYAVSSTELDWLVNFCRDFPGVLGSRMTGAGFGGCIVTLMERAHADELVQSLPSKYLQITGRVARGWICDAEAGAHIL